MHRMYDVLNKVACVHYEHKSCMHGVPFLLIDRTLKQSYSVSVRSLVLSDSLPVGEVGLARPARHLRALPRLLLRLLLLRG